MFFNTNPICAARSPIKDGKTMLTVLHITYYEKRYGSGQVVVYETDIGCLARAGQDEINMTFFPSDSNLCLGGICPSQYERGLDGQPAKIWIDPTELPKILYNSETLERIVKR